MSTQTTTIRVPTQTRDRLAAQARDRGISIAALLAELASSAEREAFFHAEREAARADAKVRAASEEDRDWDDATGDGVA
ncbi:type II toxin-antitoxin system antitoxin MazE7 [Mycobacterium sp. LTG2003]